MREETVRDQLALKIHHLDRDLDSEMNWGIAYRPWCRFSDLGPAGYTRFVFDQLELDTSHIQAVSESNAG